MTSTSWSTVGPDERAFLQRRVAQLGLVAGWISVLALGFLFLLAIGGGALLITIKDPSTFWHVVAAVLMLSIWFLARGGEPSVRYLYAVEAVGLVGAAAAYSMMMLSIRPEEAPGMIAAFAITYVLLAHAIFVPSTATHTAVLGVAMAIPLLGAVYWNFSHADAEFYRRVGLDPASPEGLNFAASRTVFIAMWATCTTVFCTAATWVIYGLRKEVDSVRQLGQYTLEAEVGQGGMAIGLIHRDIKPSNIILTRQGGVPDVAKVLDFGLVKDLQAETGHSLTQAGEVRGTPQYLSPESITDPESIDARSDLYALAAVGYFLLTAQHVFSGATVFEVCSHHLQTPPVAPSARAKQQISPALDAFLLRCLAKSPTDRPENAASFIEELSAVEVEPWGTPQAERWWQEFGARFTTREAKTVTGEGKTVVVDFEVRSAAAAGE